MINVRATAAATQKVKLRIDRIKEAMRPERVDVVVAGVALETWKSLVHKTPRGWTGNLAKAWYIERVELGLWYVRNRSQRILRFIEYGTPAGSPGTGRIYPRVKKALFIPLTEAAALLGWSPSLQSGVDYLLRKSVRGIKPRKIVASELPLVRRRLKEAMKSHIRKALNAK